MSVSRNQESGVLSRQTSICSSGIPIKKRRFPFVPLPSPPRDEVAAPCSKINNTENKRESTGIDSSVVNNTSKDSVLKSGVIKNSLNEVKKGIVADIIASSVLTDVCTEPRPSVICSPTQLDVKKEAQATLRVNSVQNNVDSGKCQDKGISSAVISAPVDKVNSNFSSLVKEITAGHAVPNSNLRYPTVNVKKEINNFRSQGDNKHELSTALENVKLSMISNKVVNSSLGDQTVDLSSQVIDKPLLSLALSQAELPENMGADATVTDSNVIMSSTNRSNWDLNTTMDAWEGSTEDAASHDTLGADEFSSSLVTHDVKPSFNYTSLVDVRVDKGKHVGEPFEEGSARSTSSMSFQPFNAEDSLCLSLSTSSPQDSCWVMPQKNLQRPIPNSVSSGSIIVKSEPVHENLKPDLSLVRGGTMESLNRIVNKTNIVSCEASKSLAGNSLKVIEPASFKSEVCQESNQQTHNGGSLSLKRPSDNIIQNQKSCSSSFAVVSGSITPQPVVSKLSIHSEMITHVGVLDRSGHYSNTIGINIKDIMNPSITRQMPEPVNYSDDPGVCDDGKVNSGETVTFSMQKSDNSNNKPNTCTEDPSTDKEKISAMVEGETYVSDYESDGNLGGVSQTGRDDGQHEKVDDDYEDGEFRELPLKSVVEDPTRERMLKENIKEIEGGSEMGVPPDQSTINEKHNDIELHDEANDHNEPTEAMTNENSNQLVSDYVSLPLTISEQVASVPTEAKVSEKSQLNPCVQENVPGVLENVLLCHGETNLKDIILESASVARNENNKVSNEAGTNENGGNIVGIPNSSFSKVEVTVNEHNSFKDSAPGGKRSRIITLPRASNSPSKIRSLPGRSFTAWSGRERYSDVDGDNLHFQGHREDTYGDESKKFRWDRSFRSSRTDFKHDRGRGTGRFNSSQKKWDFPSKSYNVPAGQRFNRSSRASAVADTGLPYNDFVAAPDFTRTSPGRVGRKPLTEEFCSFRQSSSRRLSPESRDGATIRSLPNLHRIPESGSDLPGRRHQKSFRGLPDDISDPVYTRPQASYDEISDQFVRGNQEYSTIQRRVFPRARSKSPGTARAPPRSPGTWASSRRRFNDNFNNHSDQIQNRPMYRLERMRSPDRVCYTDELGDRRRVSPNYVTRASKPRDMEYTRENGHVRPTISSRRSPSDQVFPRTTRRLDVVDSRGRTDSEEYFSRPIHSGRFQEFRGDGNNNERRKLSEQRSLFRPSIPSHGGGNENYRNNAEDGSKPLRFCSDQDTEYLQITNVRQRDFDRGTKTRPLIKQRQISSTEGEEGSFRQTEEVWHDESFSDGSGMKKRRF